MLAALQCTAYNKVAAISRFAIFNVFVEAGMKIPANPEEFKKICCSFYNNNRCQLLICEILLAVSECLLNSSTSY